MLNKNIPAILIAGVFFFCLSCMADSLSLSTDLYEKGEWDLCRRECRRALLNGETPAERLQLLYAMATVRTASRPENALPLFEPVSKSTNDLQAAAIASYETGRLQWMENRNEEALESFAFAFHSTTNKELFLHAACSIFLLANESPQLKEGREDLFSQINTSRGQWYGRLFRECAKPDPEAGLPATPNWFIRFYRNQISPAIGDRCVLEPSCSEYFHQAYCGHGLRAFPMTADRFFREPEVSNSKANPVILEDGRIRYSDPLEDHDFWMKE